MYDDPRAVDPLVCLFPLVPIRQMTWWRKWVIMQTDKALGTCWPQSEPPKSGPSDMVLHQCLHQWLPQGIEPLSAWPLLSIHAIHANNAASSRSLDLWLTVGVGALVSDFSHYLTLGCLSSPDYPHQDTIKGVCLPCHFPFCFSSCMFIMELALYLAHWFPPQEDLY